MLELVNGYVCRNCTDVELAKKGVDPARPKDGPNGVFALDPAEAAEKARGVAKPGELSTDRGPAVTLSGALASVTPPDTASKLYPDRPGATLDLRV